LSSPPPSQEDKVTHLVLMTGGLDSSVLLMLVKEKIAQPDGEVKIISAGDAKYIDPSLEKAGLDKTKNVYANPEGFEMPGDLTTWNEQKWKDYFHKLKEEKINVLYVGITQEEGDNNLPASNYSFWQNINSIAQTEGISVSTPISTVTKQAIILMAAEDYGLDISKLAPPTTGETDEDKIRIKIRDDGFKSVWSSKLGKYIKDPFKKEAKASEGQQAQQPAPTPAPTPQQTTAPEQTAAS
jgi:hypothetical protein